jgi:hypothetical protein
MLVSRDGFWGRNKVWLGEKADRQRGYRYLEHANDILLDEVEGAVAVIDLVERMGCVLACARACHLDQHHTSCRPTCIVHDHRRPARVLVEKLGHVADLPAAHMSRLHARPLGPGALRTSPSMIIQQSFACGALMSQGITGGTATVLCLATSSAVYDFSPGSGSCAMLWLA